MGTFLKSYPTLCAALLYYCVVKDETWLHAGSGAVNSGKTVVSIR